MKEAIDEEISCVGGIDFLDNIEMPANLMDGDLLELQVEVCGGCYEYPFDTDVWWKFVKIKE